MTGTVLGLFGDHDAAQVAIEELRRHGFAKDSVSVVASDQDAAFDGESAATGMTSGAVVGGVLGLLVGLGAIFIPGGFIVAGPIAGLLTGAATGGVLGALIGLGIPKEHADAYAEGIRRGGVLLAVEAMGREPEARQILTGAGAVDIHDLESHPHTVEEAELNRQSTTAESYGADMGGLNTNTQVTGSPGIGQSGITRGAMTDSYTGIGSSVGTGTVALPSNVSGESRHGTVDQTTSSEARDNDLTAPPSVSEDYQPEFDGRFANLGMTYDQALPAFEFGHQMANRLPTHDWAASEQELRNAWETRDPGTWILYRDVIRAGWDRTPKNRATML